MDCSTPGLPVLHHLPKFAQVHLHCIGDIFQPSHPLTPQSFLASGTFSMNHLFTSDNQNTGASASASVLPGLILCCPRDFQESSPASQFEGISSLMFCLLYGPALTTIRGHWEDHSLDCIDLCRQSNVSAFQHTFLPRSNHLLISWLQLPSAVILEPKKRKSVTTSTFSPLICHAVMGTDAMILIFFNI